MESDTIILPPLLLPIGRFKVFKFKLPKYQGVNGIKVYVLLVQFFNYPPPLEKKAAPDYLRDLMAPSCFSRIVWKAPFCILVLSTK